MKFICVPLNQDAQKRLDFDECKDGDLLKITFDDETFYKLWDAGFFAHINHITGTNIDNFEDDSITDQKLLKRVLESTLFEKFISNEALAPSVKSIKNLFIEAESLNTGVFFYF